LTDNPCFTRVKFFSVTALNRKNLTNRDKRPIQSFAYIINYNKKRIVNPVKLNQQAYTRQDPYFPDGIVEPPLYYNTGYQEQSYPGITPYYNYGSPAPTAVSASTASASSSFNFNQIKGIIDRMGGIDGLMGHVTKIQKIIQSIQQLSPMLKLLMSAKARTRGQQDGAGLGPTRRRRSSSTSRNTKKTYKRRSR
jgi:hypothetical protein